MFVHGERYRVWSQQSGGRIPIEGEMVGLSNHLLVLNVEGVKTAFHLASGSVAYVEQIDEEAERARDKARGDGAIAGMMA